jgi:hypothetical protein
MVRTTKALFCNEDHGSGDVTFPALIDLIEMSFIFPPDLRRLRAEAKAAGWKYIKGRDYCEGCVIAMRERGECR